MLNTTDALYSQGLRVQGLKTRALINRTWLWGYCKIIKYRALNHNTSTVLTVPTPIVRLRGFRGLETLKP